MRSEDTATPHFTLHTKNALPFPGFGRRQRFAASAEALHFLCAERLTQEKENLPEQSVILRLAPLAQDDIGWFVRSLKNN